MMKQGATLPVLVTNIQPYSNFPLGRSLSNSSTSSSIQQILLNSSCSNHPVLSRLSFRSSTHEPWKRFPSDNKESEIKLKRTKSNINVTQSRDIINSSNEQNIIDENIESSTRTSMRTSFDSLYAEMNDIALQLAEERLKHKQTQVTAEEKLLHQLLNQEKRFKEVQQNQLRDHRIQLKEQEEKFFKLLNEEQTQSLRREEHLKNELEFVKKSFHTYKAALEKENDQKLQIKVAEAITAMKLELPKQEELINKKVNEAISHERKNNNLRLKTEIENLQKQHKQEIELMQTTIDEASVDQEHLESVNTELISAKLEIAQAKERITVLSKQINDLKNQNNATIRKFNEYRQQFTGKAKQTEKV